MGSNSIKRDVYSRFLSLARKNYFYSLKEAKNHFQMHTYSGESGFYFNSIPVSHVFYNVNVSVACIGKRVTVFGKSALEM